MSQSSTAPPPARQGLVAALQRGLVSAHLLVLGGGLLDRYHRVTTDAFLAPSWGQSLQFATPARSSSERSAAIAGSRAVRGRRLRPPTSRPR